ncbi:MAG: sugar kinase [Deltaproteobacteria bacterium]|nr:sugar kinase [Deltaproteobacteria bacterium]MBW1732509.1 sugar kinase [Deltaproteobacteria bacterium]MBW2034351.1 sugar kinase [Deltaproteobacteria bacterium]MBW2358752.1 sugar kinase [Deltaproteobacteria bacterium]
MFAVVGTVPDREFPLVSGEVNLEDNVICIQGKKVSVNRGTPALLAAAIKTCEVLDQPAPFGYLVGDIGQGDGSRRLYKYLNQNLGKCDPQSKSGTSFNTIAFHYLQPDVDGHNRVLFAVDEMAQRPVLIADAGFMYAAKMSGQSAKYDLFTPDVGELAFLADEEAPHPFYTRGFILHEENRIPELISRAYEHDNAPRYLLVKGGQDYVADSQGIQATIDSPVEGAMEAMGGTGDTLTGIVAALIAAEIEIKEAAVIAARTNRLAGSFAKPTPATQVMEIVEHIPRALEAILYKDEGISEQIRA